jgi:hypothetical protein
MNARLLCAGLLLAGSTVGCVVYDVPPPGYTVAPAASFDRSWAATVGALRDQGVTVTEENREAGVVRGRRGSINVVGNVRTQADGSVRVQFDTTGATATDPQLIDRVSQAYERRMGR